MSHLCFKLLVLVGFLAICCPNVSQAQLDPQMIPSGTEGTLSITTEAPTRGRFFRSLFEPIRVTFQKAKELFTSGAGNIESGIDSVRLQGYKIFLTLYNKSYSAEELPRRMALFFERRKLIEESIKNFTEGRSLFAMRENTFSDWDDDEIKKLTGISLPDLEELNKEEVEGSTNASTITEPIVGNSNSFDDEDEDNFIVRAQIPAEKDWRTSGCIAEPVNQLKCGACYAIATMGVVEAKRCLNQVSSPTLSSQQIVDCSTPRAGYANYGCDGGWPTRVLKYLQDVRVVSRESCYPFVRRQNTCKLRTMQSTSGCTVNASPSNGRRLDYKVLRNERDMLYHVATTGPIVGVIQASDKFLYYGKGIFDDPRCTRRRDDVDHAIQLVGYGRENGADYWLIKNSWGTTTWGEGGYGKVKRGTNACSIGYFGWAVTS